MITFLGSHECLSPNRDERRKLREWENAGVAKPSATMRLGCRLQSTRLLPSTVTKNTALHFNISRRWLITVAKYDITELDVATEA